MVLLDNMNNDFINQTGAWPECYLIADKDGVCKEKTSFIQNGEWQLEYLRRTRHWIGSNYCPWKNHKNCDKPEERA